MIKKRMTCVVILLAAAVVCVRNLVPQAQCKKVDLSKGKEAPMFLLRLIPGSSSGPLCFFRPPCSSLKNMADTAARWCFHIRIRRKEAYTWEKSSLSQ